MFEKHTGTPAERRHRCHLLQRKLLLLILDIASVILSQLAALFVWVGFSMEKIGEYPTLLYQVLPLLIPVALLVFYAFRLYSSLWIFAGFTELFYTVLACFVTTGFQALGLTLLQTPLSLAYHVLFLFFLTLFIVAIRFSYRLLRRLNSWLNGSKNAVRVMIVGAGEAAAILIREISSSDKVDYAVACLIDDDIHKKGSYLSGHRIVGGRDAIVEAAEKYRVDEIFIAIPSAPQKVIRELLEICRRTDCRLKILPGLYQLINEEVSVSKLRPVEIEDVLGREPIQVDLDEICGYIRDQVVLVTGGGGSIGSELCRQIAAQGPRQLIVFDIYENNAYELQLELKETFPQLELVTLIGSVRNEDRVRALFETYRPDIVYHAAAHKHVPLMEDSPGEAIKNNVFGTYNVAKAAGETGTRRFVLISTDKAVNPTNVMGASKRLCEMIVQMMNGHFPDTELVAVRFGNVLGSNGSVVPLFRRQIEAGGPVTVTHPEIIRYFMTIPEAVSLVLQAGAYAKGGEIFVLDMGEPVKIDTLARALIRLSGFTPDVDIKIQYTGLRPGEKLYEEMLMEEEGLQDTANRMIHIGKPLVFDEDKLKEGLKRLKEAADNEQPVIPLIKELVPTYTYTPMGRR